ncbi:unnamed protein product [Soboliphyme baturini]|uniref:SCP domain-containing protein n=1 Tax=Soboliphyme baturini TaxID=241478 RepID=A0A183IIU8_9BILA|nr:unnamed protein product [Soboliphyme baturini]
MASSLPRMRWTARMALYHRPNPDSNQSTAVTCDATFDRKREMMDMHNLGRPSGSMNATLLNQTVSDFTQFTLTAEEMMSKKRKHSRGRRRCHAQMGAASAEKNSPLSLLTVAVAVAIVAATPFLRPLSTGHIRSVRNAPLVRLLIAGCEKRLYADRWTTCQSRNYNGFFPTSARSQGDDDRQRTAIMAADLFDQVRHGLGASKQRCNGLRR